jgi:ribonuclease HI
MIACALIAVLVIGCSTSSTLNSSTLNSNNRQEFEAQLAALRQRQEALKQKIAQIDKRYAEHQITRWQALALRTPFVCQLRGDVGCEALPALARLLEEQIGTGKRSGREAEYHWQRAITDMTERNRLRRQQEDQFMQQQEDQFMQMLLAPPVLCTSQQIGGMVYTDCY